MNTFNDIKELVSTLKREEKLISEMFGKRKSLNYKLGYALELVDDDEDRINFLLQRSVLRENGGFLEIDDLFLDFFEQVLDVNEEVNLSYINEHIKSIKDHIDYYLNENHENKKYQYLRFVKKTLRKMGTITLKSVVDIRRNIEHTFKNEANYKNKQLKLENLDQKRATVDQLIKNTLALVNEEELTFFKTALDEELDRIMVGLKDQLGECSHNLIEIEKQIIDYLNQIKRQGAFTEKLRKLKYLKGHFTIKEETDIKAVLAGMHHVVFEARAAEPLNLSLDQLRVDEKAFDMIRQVAKKHQNRQRLAPELAEGIAEDFLANTVEEEVMIDLEEVKNHFLATSDNLFHFLAHYDFYKAVSFEERVTIFCQMVSQFEQSLTIADDFQTMDGIAYAMVYPK